MGQEPDQIRREIEQTRDQMGNTVEALSHKADVPGRVKENLADKRDRLKSQMQGAGSKVSDSTPDVDVTGNAKKAAGIAQENPLGLMIGGAAIGFLAGLALPSTRVEDEQMGEISDQVIQQAKDTGSEALEHGKQVAQDAATAAADTAKESGNESAQQLRDSAQEKVEEVRS